MEVEPVRVLLVSSHPAQYAAPQYRRYAADPRVNVTVAFCSLAGAELAVDRDFGVQVKWDIPLLNGYTWVNPPNRSPRPNLHGFWGLLNPGMWSLVRRGGFDVVVCYGYRAASFWIAGVAARLSGTALVLTTDAHSLAPRDGRRWKVPAKRILLRQFFRRADGVFAPSTRTRRFVETLGVGPERVFLTPYVVENGFFSDLARSANVAEVRARWRIPPGATVALFCAKLASWKRPADLLEAASRVEGLHVIYAGDGPLRAELEQRTRDLGLQGRVRLLGFVNQRRLPEVYAASDVLVLPSEYEPFGVVVNEAFACGRPAVVSDACGAVGDLVRDAETGYVVPAGDVSLLAERLRTLQRDGLLRRSMGDRARLRIAEWGPEQNVEAFVQACLTLRDRRSRA